MRSPLEIVETITGKDQMRVCIDKSGQNNAPNGIDNLRVACLFLDLVAEANDIDLAIADQHSAVANDRQVGHLRADTRSARPSQGNQL